MSRVRAANNGKDTYRKWENGGGPSGPVAAFLSLLVEGLNHDSDDVQVFCVDYIRRQVGIVPI